MLYYVLKSPLFFFFFKCSFLTVTAVSYQKKSLSYSLLTNPSGLFSIDWATGDISLTRSVDYESDQHQYLLLVRAEENEKHFSSAAEVGVHFCSLYVFPFSFSFSRFLYRFASRSHFHSSCCLFYCPF